MAYKKYYEQTESNIESYNKDNSGEKEIEVPQGDSIIGSGTLFLKKLNPFD